MGRGIAELLVDPIFQSWIRALWITGYMQGWKTKLNHRKDLIVEDRWDPRNE